MGSCERGECKDTTSMKSEQRRSTLLILPAIFVLLFLFFFTFQNQSLSTSENAATQFFCSSRNVLFEFELFWVNLPLKGIVRHVGI